MFLLDELLPRCILFGCILFGYILFGGMTMMFMVALAGTMMLSRRVRAIVRKFFVLMITVWLVLVVVVGFLVLRLTFVRVAARYMGLCMPMMTLGALMFIALTAVLLTVVVSMTFFVLATSSVAV